MTITNDIRKSFIDYFKKQGHTIVKSSPLVPQNDPTLMFTNSGMVQFKNYLSGAEKAPYPCAATIQKSVRAGGKHNDLDNVGYTVRHHTFFEMIGNFSFGDYFKEKAITYAWEMLTKEIGLPKEKLLVTVYHTDDEARALWKKIAGFTDEKIISIATKDNFWQMGDTGPCGPCSEIFYDHGDKYWGGQPGTPEEDGDRFIEIWNLVFDQFEDLPDGSRIESAVKSIDTGAGLERWSAILHGTNDNFAIDIFRGLIEEAASLSGVNPDGDEKMSLRVIADHLRSSAFLIADGVLPSNEGRGYVLRRIMRRAMRHVHLIGYKDPLMYRLVPVLNAHMAETYPELTRAQGLIEETLRLEEIRFKQMLDKGMKLLDAETADLKEGDSLSGETAFKLYDTYGFPLDLTQDALRAKKMTVDVSGFDIAMEKQREDARKAWAGSGDTAMEKVWLDLSGHVPATDFLGYGSDKGSAEVLALVKDGVLTDEISADDTGVCQVVFNQTPFYAEMGGEIGDTGCVKSDGFSAVVTDTQKKAGNLYAHTIEIKEGTLKKGATAELCVDTKRRNQIRAHHSATHLLQAALQKVLGSHVQQKGSLVTDERLRFDFSHSKQMTTEEIEQTEMLVNEMILGNLSGTTRLMSSEEAIAEGAMALFGEKYGETVRVVSFGDEECPVSMELCGGLHVDATGKIGLFKILSESAVGAGVRRIEAIAGKRVYAYLSELEKNLKKTSEVLKVSVEDIPTRVENLLSERKTLEKEMTNMRQKVMFGTSAVSGSAEKEMDGQKFTYVAQVLKDIPAKDLKPMVDKFKQSFTSSVIVLVDVVDEKVSLVVGVTDNLTDKVDAVRLVRLGAEVLGGKGGGGRPDMAQAGGTMPEKADEVLKVIEEALYG